MSTSLNVSQSINKVNNMTDSELTVGANLDDSNRSTSSSATLDQTSHGSNGHESDAANREAVSPESEEWPGVFNFSKSLRQQQKSVCFHSVTTQSGEKKVTNGMKFINDINFFGSNI